MPRTLILVRHAKAVQGGPSDAQRPLAERGVRDARVGGVWLASLGIELGEAVVSPAVRAQQTWDEIEAGLEFGLGATPVRSKDRRIYESTVADLLDVIRDAQPGTQSLAVVGHNPSMHELAYGLDDGSGDPHSRSRLTSDFPTNSIAVFEIRGDWSEVDLGAATLRHLAAPRDQATRR